MNFFTKLQLLICLSTFAIALPSQKHKREIIEALEAVENISESPKNDTKKFNYASLQSHLLATNILKDNINVDGNQVFSPLGISTILAILAEGSRGDTYKEFEDALGYPKDKIDLRKSFKEILQTFKQNNFDNTPSFKTWFYIYRNNTAKDEFKKNLQECYKVEVKDIDNYDFNWNEPDTAVESTTITPSTDDKVRDLSVETKDKITSSLNPSNNDVLASVDIADSQNPNNNNSKDILGFEDLKKSEFFDEKLSSSIAVSKDNKKVIENVNNNNPLALDDDMTKDTNRMDDDVHNGEEKVTSKFDAVVDDKQYVEVPIIRAEIAKEAKEKRKQEEEAMKIQENLDEKELKMKDESVAPNIIAAVLKEIKKEEEEIMEVENLKEVDDAGEGNIIIEEIILEKSKDELPIEVPILNSVKDNNNQVRRIDLSDVNDEDNETIRDDEKIDVLRKHNKNLVNDETILIIESNEPEKITLPLKKFDDDNGEIMEAMESRFFKQGITESRALLLKDDIASALSANSIIGREQPSKTKMLLFNGLYYRGNWAHPFMELRCDTQNSFYSAGKKDVPIKMMKTRGNFRMAQLESLDSDALELPYENDRYSFVIVVPKQKDGLSKLIEKIQPVDIQMLQTRFTETLTAISLPKFEVEETSRSEKTLKKLGLKRVFSSYLADLGDISDEGDLHVEEVVQHVSLKVDEGAVSENALSAANSLGRSDKIPVVDGGKEKHFDVDRPFLYFVMDRTSNFVIVAGKITEPQLKVEFGLDF